MASTKLYLLACLMVALSSIDTSSAARQLLQTLPSLPTPAALPPLPAIPTLPTTSLPLPKPTFPPMPAVPKLALPPLPGNPFASGLPNLGSFLPTTMPSIPFLTPPPSN